MDILDKLVNLMSTDLINAIGGGDGLLLSFLFLSVFAVSLVVSSMFRPSRSLRARLQGDDAEDERPQLSLKRRDPDTAFHLALKQLEKHVVLTNDEERTAIRMRLIQAGYGNESAVQIYYLLRIVLAIALPVVFLFMAPTYWPEMPTKKLVMIAGGLAGAGIYIPFRFVDAKLARRKQFIENGFPDALDMLVVCVQAGLGLDAALVRVGSQIASAHPILAEQFGIVALELRAGKSREEALRNLATRTAVADVSNFVTLLIQSEALGADLTQTLKVQADEMRAKRMLRAEETASKLPVKLTLPLVSCILPAMFAVVLGPGLINIARNVLPHLGN
jgi:tight adherence protein C